MLNLKKNIILINFKNLYYFFQFYKLKSIFLSINLKKREIWFWPLLLNKSLIFNKYISDY